MAYRLLSAVVGIPLLLLVIWLGYPWFSILVGIVATLGVLEFSSLGLQRGARPITYFAIIWALGFVATAHFITRGPLTEAVLPLVFVAGSALSLAWLLRRRASGGIILDWSYTSGAAFYLGWLLSYAILLRGLERGWEWTLITLLGTFATDTSAFFVGRAIGKRPLAPSISPSKTWEGAVAGAMGGIGAVFIMAVWLDMGMAIWQILTLGAMVSIVAQIGDLVESYLKRLSGTKDAGKIIPGHGGILDRLDSVVFNLAVVYHFAVWIGL